MSPMPSIRRESGLVRERPFTRRLLALRRLRVQSGSWNAERPTDPALRRRRPLGCTESDSRVVAHLRCVFRPPYCGIRVEWRPRRTLSPPEMGVSALRRTEHAQPLRSHPRSHKTRSRPTQLAMLTLRQRRGSHLRARDADMRTGLLFGVGAIVALDRRVPNEKRHASPLHLTMSGSPVGKAVLPHAIAGPRRSRRWPGVVEHGRRVVANVADAVETTARRWRK